MVNTEMADLPSPAGAIEMKIKRKDKGKSKSKAGETPETKEERRARKMAKKEVILSCGRISMELQLTVRQSKELFDDPTQSAHVSGHETAGLERGLVSSRSELEVARMLEPGPSSDNGSPIRAKDDALNTQLDKTVVGEVDQLGTTEAREKKKRKKEKRDEAPAIDEGESTKNSKVAEIQESKKKEKRKRKQQGEEEQDPVAADEASKTKEKKAGKSRKEKGAKGKKPTEDAEEDAVTAATTVAPRPDRAEIKHKEKKKLRTEAAGSTAVDGDVKVKSKRKRDQGKAAVSDQGDYHPLYPSDHSTLPSFSYVVLWDLALTSLRRS